MDITKVILKYDDLFQLIKAGMTDEEVEWLLDEFNNVTIDFLLNATKQFPNLKDYVNVCRQEEESKEKEADEGS
jgi:hypothetical protein